MDLKVTYTTVTGTEVYELIALEKCKYDEVHDEYAWTLNDIAVKDMGTAITAQICYGVDVPISGEHRYSLESYAANRIPKTEDPVFRELLVRLMKYSRSAKAYFEIENP
ncbi:MAG: hypothetical protein IJL66_09745 [Lachnospiraceae bacterium]|nr:hypothetical protein [Lachnospiraceae bacterium]